MNINKISFGNIVKVNAPALPAMEIASIANGYSGKVDKNINEQIKKLFPDKQQDMISIEVMDHKTSYLFSGKEKKEYQKLYHNKRREMERIKSQAKQSYNTDYLEYLAIEKHKRKVLDLVSKSKNIKEINVEMTAPNSCNIKSINVVS